MILRNVDNSLLPTRRNIPENLNPHFNIVILSTFTSSKSLFLYVIRHKSFLKSPTKFICITNTEVLFDYPDGIKLKYLFSLIVVMYGCMRTSGLFVDTIIIIIICM